MKAATTTAPAPNRVMFSFRLYVMGDTQNSLEAVANLEDLCRNHIPDQHEIELVDVSVNPERALADGIFMTPTLIKLAPSPTRMVVGTLSNPQPVIQALGLNVPVRVSDTLSVLLPNAG
jgi:circadian clock protein KaiB